MECKNTLKLFNYICFMTFHGPGFIREIYKITMIIREETSVVSGDTVSFLRWRSLVLDTGLRIQSSIHQLHRRGKGSLSLVPDFSSLLIVLSEGGQVKCWITTLWETLSFKMGCYIYETRKD